MWIFWGALLGIGCAVVLLLLGKALRWAGAALLRWDRRRLARPLDLKKYLNGRQERIVPILVQAAITLFTIWAVVRGFVWLVGGR